MTNSLNDEVTTAYREWDAAFNRADAAAVAKAYLANAKFLPPTHTVMSGPAEVQQFFAGLFSNGVSRHKLEVIEAGGDGNVVYAAAKWSATAKGPDGKTQDLSGIATHIFKRQPDGALKLALHTFN